MVLWLLELREGRKLAEEKSHEVPSVLRRRRYNLLGVLNCVSRLLGTEEWQPHQGQVPGRHGD